MGEIKKILDAYNSIVNCEEWANLKELIIYTNDGQSYIIQKNELILTDGKYIQEDECGKYIQCIKKRKGYNNERYIVKYKILLDHITVIKEYYKSNE